MIFIKFKELADNKFNGKYSYVESSFEGRFVDIICKEHGRFRKDIYSHLSGVGCKKCNSLDVKLLKIANLFVDKNDGYKFIGLETVKRKTYMKFECPKGHGLKFMRGCEKTCCKCSRLAERKKKLQILADENNTKVSIGDSSITTICPTHGENTVSFNSFKHSKKCKRVNHKYTTAYFKSECEKLKTSYDYSKVSCNSCYDTVEIICKEHGSFYQKAYSHLAGHGCKRCSFVETNSSYSQAELEIFGIIGGVHGDRNLIYPKELDVYCKEHNLAVEYDGVYWHSTDDFSKIDEFKHKHVWKTEMCLAKNTKLLHIFENEWVNERTKRVWVGELLKRTQQITPTATDCIENITVEMASKFVKENSLKPTSCINGVSFGLFTSGVLHTVCQFLKTKDSYTFVKTEHPEYKPKTQDVLSTLSMFKSEHQTDILCEIDNRFEFIEDYSEFGFEFCSSTKPKAYQVCGANVEETSDVERTVEEHRVMFDCGTTNLIIKKV